MAEVHINPSIEQQLARSPQMAAMLKRRVEIAAAEARNIAPVGDGNDPHAGRFRDSIRAEVVVAGGQERGRLLSTDPDASYIIHGTSDTPPHDTLMRSIEATRGV